MSGGAADRVDAAHEEAGRAVAPLARSRGLRIAARAGYVVTGLVYLLIGVTAIRMALGAHGGADADQTGAIRLIEAVPGGAIVLWPAAIAFVALALWLAVEGLAASASRRDRGDRARILVVHLAKAAAYAVLAASTIGVLANAEGDAEDAADDTSAQLLGSGPGTALLVVAGLGVIAFGIALAVRGIRRSFARDLDLAAAGGARELIVGVSAVGYVARGIAFALIGATLLLAAALRDPERASGLSGALAAVLEVPFGQPALIAIGIGLIVGGLATGLRARFQRMR